MKFKTHDGTHFDVSPDVASMSDVIRGMLEDTECKEDEEVVIPKVSSAVFAKVLEYCNRHTKEAPTDAATTASSSAKLSLSEWDNQFITGIPVNTLIELIEATNYLSVKKLFDLSTSALANHIKGKTAVEIRAILNIANDLTPEEEEEIKRETEWAVAV